MSGHDLLLDLPPLKAGQTRAVRQAAEKLGHPRLFTDTRHKAELLGKVRSGICRRMAEHLRAACEPRITPGHAQFLNLDQIRGEDLVKRPKSAGPTAAAPDLAFAGWLWDEPRFTEAARTIVLRWAREAPPVGSDDDPEARGHANALETGIVGMSFGWAADFVWPSLSDAERGDVVQHVRDYYIAYARNRRYTHERRKQVGFNMTLSAACGIGLASLAVAEHLDEEELDFAVGEAMQSAFAYQTPTA